MADLDGEGELLRRACRGDEAAFVVLYERHRRVVFRFVYRMLGSVQTAEDVTHECFLALLTHPDRFDPSRASLRTFLCAIGRNLAFKQFRRRGVENAGEPIVESEGPEGPVTPEPLQRLLEGERREVVQQAILSLAPLQREVLILFEYEGHSLAEIAQVVEADTGTVKARLHRARETLRRLLSPWLSAGGAAGDGVPSTSVGAAGGARRTVEKMA